MKILLLNPPFKDGRFSRTSRSPAITKSGSLYYPIWLAYAAGVLEKEGFDVRLVDAPAEGIAKEAVIRIAKSFEPDITVIDTSTPSIYSDVEVAGAIKGELTSTYMVLVGTHPSSLPEETLSLSKAIDAVTRGEYDYTLRDLAKAIDSGSDIWAVQGLSYRDGDRIIHNEDRPHIEDLDSLPFVSAVYKKQLGIRNYFLAASFYPFVMIITGRGCPFRCSFCLYPQVFHSRRYRLRSAENVADEFEYIVKELPEVKQIGIEDDTFTADRKRVKDICDILMKRGIKIPWYAATRPDLNYETMKIMKKAGLRLLIAGFESGSQEVLDNIHKGIKVDEMVKFAADAKRAGVLVHGCFIIGNPGERLDTMMCTIDFARRLRCDTVQFFPMILYPGTEIYSWAKEKGYLKTEDYSKWVTEEGFHSTVLNTPEFSDTDLLKWCDYARRRCYLRPGYLLYKALRCFQDPREFVRTVKSLGTFYRHLV